MFAIVQIGSHQFKVVEGDLVKANRMKNDIGKTVTLDKVLMFAKGADASFTRLTPARVVDLRVHVGVKAILSRCGQIPAGRGSGFLQANLHDRLDALEAVFPGNHETQRCAVLVGE